MAVPVSSIFHPGWVFHHRASANSGALARVLIERPIRAGQYNFDTAEVDGAEAIPIYRGSAQIQKVAFPTNREFVEDRAKFQRMQFTLGFETNELTPKEFSVHVNDRITVLQNLSDPEKVGSVYYVFGDENSSNAWQCVLIAQTNMKQG